MHPEPARTHPPSAAARQFRALLNDVSQMQDLFVEELRALKARVRELEGGRPAPGAGRICAHYESMEGTLRGWSQEAKDLYGYAPEEAIGHPASMLSPEGCANLPWEGGGQGQAFPRVRKNGQVFLARVHTTPIEDQEGRTLGRLVQEVELAGEERP